VVAVAVTFFLPSVAHGVLWRYSGAGAWNPSTSYLGNQYDPREKAVPMEAVVSESPAQITLKVYSGAGTTNLSLYNVNVSGSYDIYRKTPESPGCGTMVGTVAVDTNIATWVDTNVVVGQVYEYSLAYTGTKQFVFGNLLAGIKADRTLPKGRMAVVVSDDVIARLPAEYAQYKADLAADGWTVHEIITLRAKDYLSNGTGPTNAYGTSTAPYPTNHIAIRTQLQALYSTYSNELKNVLLLGKVPVARSGLCSYNIYADGHGNRAAFGADAYYADMDGIWTDNYSNELLAKGTNVPPITTGFVNNPDYTVTVPFIKIPSDDMNTIVYCRSNNLTMNLYVIGNIFSISNGLLQSISAYQDTSISSSAGTINTTGDNKFDAEDMNEIGPNDNLELGFGRIDFSAQISGEYDSLRTYFGKLHRYKMAGADFQPGRRAIMRGNFGILTKAYLADMPGLLGMTNLDYIVAADRPAVPSADYDADSDYTKTNGPYLFYFKGSEGPGYSDGGRAVFWTGMQSHWGYWFEPSYSSGQTKMQQRLAEDNFCLSFTWYIGGLSSQYDVSYLYHRLGMGYDAGDMMRVSMSDRNSTNQPYVKAQSPLFMQHMGDPALRIFMFAPPTGLQVWKSGGTPVLAWRASVAPSNEPQVLGYHVYRSDNPNGPFIRLTSNYVTTTNYADATASSGKWYYQVKAVRLETTGGGTYYNTSLAAQQDIDLTNGPNPLSVDTNSVLPGANSNTTYQASLVAIGGTPTFIWTVVSNSLPPGLTLSSSGVISGKPTQAGTFNFTVQATDLLGQIAQAQQSITVQPADLRVLFPEAGAYVSKSAPTYIARYYEPGIQILGGPTYVYDGLLRFDLSGIPANRTVVRARLILSADGLTSTNTSVVVKAALTADSGDNWSELTVCYNNEPADNTSVPVVTALSNAVPYSRLTLDVTGMAAASLNADPNRKLGVRLFTATPGNWGQALQICYSHANRLARPQLIVETFDVEPPPFASFSASPISGSVPLPVSFADTSIGSITNRFWDFGDGATTNTTATNVTHTYTATGTSTVQLIVSGPLGVSTNTQINLIRVTPPAPPSAGFTVSTNAGIAPLTVTFTDTSTGSITNRFWSFGDGAVTNTLVTSIAHTYTVARTNTVQLIVSGPAGASTNTKTAAVTVAAPKVGRLVVYDPFSDPVQMNVADPSSVPSTWITMNSIPNTNSRPYDNHSKIVAGSLSYPGMPTSQGNSWRTHQGSDDFTKNVAGITGLEPGDTVYYSFLLKVDPNDAVSAWYIRLYNTASTSSSGLPVSFGLNSNDLTQIGFSVGSRNGNFSAVESATLAHTGYNYDSTNTFLIVAGYSRGVSSATSSMNLWVNPDSATFGAATPPPPTLTVVGYSSGYATQERTWNKMEYNFNGSATGTANGQTIDEFRIATDWANAVPAAISAPSGDTDSDGIPDEWESQHFGGATNANPNALAANGINTIYETYIAGLNPTNAQSVFALSSQQVASQRLLQWSAVSGRVYGVYWTTNLMNSFQPLETNILWPQNSWTGLVSGSQGDFYKLQVELEK
jgi:PKD repeat protein